MLGEAFTLDTTTFAALSDRARARIPALSRGTWTDHNAHDPGITLLELYAYLLEQRVYWADQLTPALDRALLSLLGVVPFRARPATVVLTALPKVAGRHETLTGGSELGLDAAPPVVFTTDETIAVFSHRADEFDLVTSVTGRRLRGVDLRSGRTIAVLPNDGRPAWFDLLLRLDAPWVTRDEPISLLFELSSEVYPEWHPDAVSAPPPAEVEFLVRGLGGLRRLESWRVRDGTGGLRRSGIVRLWVGDWRPEADGSYLVRVQTDAATFTTPVRLSRVTPNSALARHRSRGSHLMTDKPPAAPPPPVVTVDTSPWPRLPGRVIELRHSNGVPLSGQVSVRVRESDTGPWTRWHEVQDLTPERADARVFLLEGRAVRFGDGRVGRQPVVATKGDRIRVDFWAGGGENGNIRAGCKFEHASLSVANPVPACGGRGDESLPDARVRAATLVRAVERTVTTSDFEERATATPGVAIGRAIAVAGLDEDRPLKVPGLTTVYVIPSAPRFELLSESVEPARVPNPKPDPGALAAVRNHLESARLLGSEIDVRPPRWRNVRLRLVIRSRTSHGPELDRRLHDAMESYLDALVGGDEGKGWPLGGSIDPSALMRRAQTELGAGALVEKVVIEVECGTPESCRPVSIGGCHLPRLVSTAVELLPMAAKGALK
jgi:hypothetical protein